MTQIPIQPERQSQYAYQGEVSAESLLAYILGEQDEPTVLSPTRK